MIMVETEIAICIHAIHSMTIRLECNTLCINVACVFIAVRIYNFQSNLAVTVKQSR